MLVVTPTSSEAAMRDLLSSGGYSFPVMPDTSGVGAAYNVRYVPTLYLIDSVGALRQQVVGTVDTAGLNRLVHDLGGG